MSEFSLYIHWPFCFSKCNYCAFNSFEIQKNLDFDLWQNAYEKSLEKIHSKFFLGENLHKNYSNKNSKITSSKIFEKDSSEKKLKTIFFGGGTPSIIPIKNLEKILEKIYSLWKVTDDVEITTELNPNSCSKNFYFNNKLSHKNGKIENLNKINNSTEFLKNFKIIDSKIHSKIENLAKIGFNRISIGVQTFDDNGLKILGRTHNSTEAISTIEEAKKFFKNVSVDLIYGYPEETLKILENDLSEIINFEVNHISAYSLIVEENSKFGYLKKINKLNLPKENISIKMFNFVREFLIKNSFENYEIANYAKNNSYSKHNLSYWNYCEYFGVGPGAHGRIHLNGKIFETVDELNYSTWIQKTINNEETLEINELSESEVLLEKIMMGLRLSSGINLTKLSQFCYNPWDIFNINKIRKFSDIQLIDFSEEKNFIKITEKGRIKSSYIISEIIRDF